jgi:hypothetical protein
LLDDDSTSGKSKERKEQNLGEHLERKM